MYVASLDNYGATLNRFTWKLYHVTVSVCKCVCKCDRFCVHICMCVCVCVRACMRACVRMHMRVPVCDEMSILVSL